MKELEPIRIVPSSDAEAQPWLTPVMRTSCTG